MMDKQQNNLVGNSNAQPREVQPREEIDLLDLASFYLRRLPIIIIAFILGAFAAGWYAQKTVTPQYQSTAKLYMVSASSGSVVDLSDLSLSTTLSGDYVELMSLRPMYEEIAEELDIGYTYSQLQKMVSVENVTDTRVVKITATSTDPQLAMDLANAVAQKAIDFLPDVMETTSKPHVAESAILPTATISPGISYYATRGAMVGLVIALAILTVIYLLDDTMKSAEDVENAIGIMPLTVIPENAAVSRSTNPEGKLKRIFKKNNKKKGDAK
jgi:capsular polysaccharide biosynthesis protein